MVCSFAFAACVAAQSAATPAPDCTQHVVDANLVNAVTPVYPDSARDLKIASATALAEVTVGPDGKPKHVSIYISSGNVAMDRATIVAAQASTYTPKLVHCSPTTGYFLFRAMFENSPATPLPRALDPVPAAVTPSPQSSSNPSPSELGSYIAQHLPMRYDEILAGTTNTITARYSASGCKITVALDYGTDFNSARSSDRSPAFSVKGNPITGHHFDGSDGGGTIDFAIVSPSSLRVSDATEYLGTEEVTPSSFEFTFRNEADAKAMVDAMTSFASACAPAAPH